MIEKLIDIIVIGLETLGEWVKIISSILLFILFIFCILSAIGVGIGIVTESYLWFRMLNEGI
jgi:hypothetical protein